MIIGRTNKLAEARSNKNTLTKSRYYYISHLVRDFIINNSIRALPIDLFCIIKKNKWRIIKYSSLIHNNISMYKDVMENNFGFSENLGGEEFAIFYDDMVNKHTQRFTLAHEIGHILLNHFKIPIQNREQEANMFAARLLMPMCILYECNMESPCKISTSCDVSLTSANYRYARLKILKERNKFYTDKNEKLIKEQFGANIKRYNKNNK